MAITVVGQSTGVTTPTAALTTTIVLPSLLAGDLILLASSEGGAVCTQTADTGFGSPQGVASRASANMSGWAKRAVASDSGATVTVTSSASRVRDVVALVLRGDGFLDGAFQSAVSAASSNNVDAPTDTPTGAHDAVVTFHGIAGTVARTWTGWTLGSAAAAGPSVDTGTAASGQALASFYLLDYNSTSATGTLTATATLGTANQWAALTVLIFAAPIVQQPGRRRIVLPWRAKRTRGTQVVTVQATLPPQPSPRTADRPGWLARPRRASVTPVPTTVTVTTQALPPQSGRVLHRLPVLRRGRATFVPVVQVVVTTQALPPQPVRDRLVWFPHRRATQTTPPPTVVQYVQQPGRRRLVPPRPRSGRSVGPVAVTAQALPPQPSPRTTDRLGWLTPRRNRGAQYVPAQVIVVTVQALPPQGRRRVWPWPTLRRSSTTDVWVGVSGDLEVTVYNPGSDTAYVDAPTAYISGTTGYVPDVTAYDSGVTPYDP